MKPERWDKVDEILQSMLERPVAEREAYLAEVCSGDEELRGDVLTLMASHEQAGSFMASPAIQGSGGDVFEDEPKLKEGDVTGLYRILKPIGRGGMGEVYLAEHTGQSREVALKILPQHFLDNGQLVQRFRQEARTVLALNHPHIVTVYDIGEAAGVHFISTEFVEGQTLRERMASEHLTIEEAVEIALQIASALAYAHERGVIHRDIKPENIMLRPDGYVKVLDFGLAKLTEKRRPSRDMHEATTLITFNTEPGMVMGTATYMSPEQVRGKQVDERADIWSLGVVLYEMIAGRAPFEGESKNDVLAAILEREPLSLMRFARSIPPELERIVMKALRKDREERYQISKDLLLDLKSLKQELEVASKLERSGWNMSDGTPSAGDEQWAASIMRRAGTSAGHRISAPQATSTDSTLAPTQRPRTRLLLLLISAFVISAGLFFLYYKFVLQKQAESRPSHFSSIKFTRLTSTGESRLAAISPDGKYIVYVADETGRQSLWIRQAATTSNVQIVPPAEVEYQGLTFSRDGDFVYYVVHDKGNPIRDLFEVTALGGTPRKLILNVDSAVTFSPDGKRLAFVRRLSDKAEDTLIVAGADGSNEQKLLTRKQPDFFSLSGPSWSPDGSMIACGAGSSDRDGRYMTVIGVEVANGTEKSLTARRWVGVGRVVWLGDSSGVMINALEQTLGLYQIWLVTSPGGDARRVTNDLSDYRDLSLTADAAVLAAAQSDQLSSLWTLEAAAANNVQQITSGKYDGFYGLDWETDGKLIYTSNAGGNQDLWLMDARGSGQKQLTVDARSNVWPSASPDGRHIVFTSDRTGTLHIWRMDIDGGNPMQLTGGSGEDWAACSPDGRWVIYTVTGGADRFTLWRVSIDGGEPVRLVGKFSLQSTVSPDGKQIACGYRPDAKSPWKLALVPIEGGQPTQTFDIPQSVELPIVVRWTPDGSALTYIDTRGGASNLWRQPIAGGPPRELSNWQSEQIFSFAWSRDGKHLAVARGTRKDDIVLIRDSP